MTMQTAINCAIKTLIDNNICKIPLSNETIEKIIKNQGFEIIAYNIPLDENDYSDFDNLNLLNTVEEYQAFTYVGDTDKYVFYRSTLSSEEKMRMLAHELGHIMLGHLSASGVRCSSGLKNEAPQEREADEFALEFLAPTCVLKNIKHLNPSVISHLTLLDRQSSEHVFFKVRDHKRNTQSENKLCEAFDITKPYKIKPILMAVGAMLSILLVTYVSNNNDDKNNTISISTPVPISTNYVDSISDNVDNVAIDSEIVVVTKTGDKYHLPDCQHVREKDNVIEMTKQEAIEKGYEPCKVCKP